MTRRKESKYDLVGVNRDLLDRSMRITRPYFVNVAGREILVYPGVFSPLYADGTEIFCSRFPYRREDAFLEVGCGTGASSIFAALNQGSRVLALDVNPLAVLNTLENARHHGLESRVQARVSDIFSAVAPGERFNTVYWNMPFIRVPKGFRFKTMLERAVFDPGYENNRRFLYESPRLLASDGRVVVGFGNVGDTDALQANAERAGFRSSIIHSEVGSSEPGPVAGSHLQFVLYEMRLR